MLVLYFSADGGYKYQCRLWREQFQDSTVAWQSPSDIPGSLKRLTLKLLATIFIAAYASITGASGLFFI